MAGIGLAHAPPIKPLVASHLHPSQKSSMTSTGPTLPTKYVRFQSSATEKVYRSGVTAVRALSAASMLSAYQAELQDELAVTLEPGLWDEMCIATDLNLCLLKATVQASGRAIGLMISQERARWLNLSTVSDSEKLKILDAPVDPKDLYGSTIEMMQKRCEEKKIEGEALQLCLSRKTQPSASPVPRHTFAQAAAGRPPPRPLRAQGSREPWTLKAPWSKNPPVPPMAPRNQPAPNPTQG
ncbi:dual adapter for phosphotyrosine and 3-phosphotyrosine and 3-phosphoinositide isoform X2 [Oncorhynchus mykiss]|uniref:dual adapter for phosphotyrosine and 3-phosphotyrosine and 3-phosphoinositide isoform X2 n=1 Tax=Oncorhynchus mykiss TaxID=8022 RepID=UPI0018782605|nr:dual adapter for phosphotyrosine and 3-phosphotyrosine and 3-phosphoinositide isoform X2 [Oncorhynchus mykiss]